MGTAIARSVEDGYDPDANDRVRDALYDWVECFATSSRYELAEWVLGLSLRDPRLTALAATNPAVAIGEPGAWATTHAQHEAIEAWSGGDDSAKQAWLDSFVAESIRHAKE